MELFYLSDWIALVGCIVGLGGLVGAGEILRSWGWRPSATRRLVHAGVGLFVAGTPLIFSSTGPLYVLALLFVVINTAAKWRRWWPAVHTARSGSWGTVTMPLVVIPAVAATWSVDPGRTFILQLAFLVLALADPLASWVGETYGRRDWIAGATVHGSAVIFGVTLVVIGTGLFGGGGWSIERSVAAALSAAVVTTASEAVSRRGWDNVFVVLSVILVLVPLHEVPGTAGQIGFALAVGVAFGAATYATRTLTAAGAVGGGLFAASLVGLGGWAWALPGFVFFVLSSGLSVLNEGRSRASLQDVATGGRRLRQVLANGGMAWLLLSVYAVLPSPGGAWGASCYVGFLGALAAAAADTWATEIGEMDRSRPWSLRWGERVQTGRSGAVSLVGTLGAVCGAASVVGAAALVDGALGSAPWDRAVVVVGAGLCGMAVDSLAGAFLQAQYRDPETDRVVERPPTPDAVPVRGWGGINNEVVNLIGTAAGTIAAMVLS